MSTIDFEAMSTPEDFEHYFASTSDYTAFIQWMQRTGQPAPSARSGSTRRTTLPWK